MPNSPRLHTKSSAHILCVSRALSPRGVGAHPTSSSTLFESAKSSQSVNTSNANSPDPKAITKADSMRRRAGIKLVEKGKLDRSSGKQSFVEARSRLDGLSGELKDAQKQLAEMERLRAENRQLRQENQVIHDMMMRASWEKKERTRNE